MLLSLEKRLNIFVMSTCDLLPFFLSGDQESAHCENILVSTTRRIIRIILVMLHLIAFPQLFPFALLLEYRPSMLLEY